MSSQSSNCNMDFICSVCKSNQLCCKRKMKIPVFTEVVALFPSCKEVEVTLFSVWNYWRQYNQSCLPTGPFTHPSLGCIACVPCSPSSPWAVDALNSEHCGRGCWQHLSATGIKRTKCQQGLWKCWGKKSPWQTMEILCIQECIMNLVVVGSFL